MVCSPAENPRRSNPIPKRNSAARQPQKSYDDFVFTIPVIQGHARVSFRKERPEVKAELIEECIANAFRAYARLMDLGKQEVIYPSVLAKYAVKQVRGGRLVGGKLNTNDILSRYAQKRKSIKIERLDRYDIEENIWKEAVVEDGCTPVPEQAAFRVDFPAWLKQQRSPKRRIAKTLALGYTTNEVARRFNLSAGRISQLRRDFEKSWEKYHHGKAMADEEELAAA